MKILTKRVALATFIGVACLVICADRVPVNAAAAAPGVLLVELGVHVEPFGLVNGRIQSGGASYDNETYFRQHTVLLRSLAAIVERHGGRATFQVQSPFIDSCTKYRDNVIGELAGRGHEIALHFHEDAHLGRNADTLAPERWIEVIGAQIAKIQALGVERVRMWSGGNLYPHLLEAATAVGLDVMSDWKNPRTQTAESGLQVTTPWKPADSPNGTDLSAFLRHDPAGRVVYLPTGVIDPKTMHEDEINGAAEPAAALKAFWSDGVSASLASVAQNPSATHVFHITLHPGELQSHDYGGDTTLDTWLREEIDPLVMAGKARWATYSQMADAYNTSAPAMADYYARYRPEVLQQLRGMTVSYHVRPPHPLYTGFGGRLSGLSDAALESALREYETYTLDLATGDLVRSDAGGYGLVSGLIGSRPVTIVTPSDDARVRAAAERVYTSLGARAIVVYHESGTRPDVPFEWRGDLLIRPSDFSVTRWTVNGGTVENFWWNMLGSRNATLYDPVAYLQQKLADWSYSRPPLVTSLIHDNNFVRSGAEGWTLSYYADTQKTTPLAAPFDLGATDPSTLRSASDQARIWENYERLVAWAAAHLNVVTSADLVDLAAAAR